jgi:hypothetical protein
MLATRLSPEHQGDGEARSRAAPSTGTPSNTAARPQQRLGRPARSRSKPGAEIDRDDLLKSLMKALKSGRRPSFYLSAMRYRVRVVSAAADGTLKLSSRGMVMSFEIDRLPEGDVQKMAESLK